MICSVFGHLQIDITETLRAKTTAELEKVIGLGCRIFFFGGFGEFDNLCYEIVSKIKEEKPKLNLERVFCVPQERYLRKKAWYFDRSDYDKVIYLTPVREWWYKAIYYRNCAMIDESSFLIFYAENRAESCAYKAYKYAQRKKDKYIVNLWGD